MWCRVRLSNKLQSVFLQKSLVSIRNELTKWNRWAALIKGWTHTSLVLLICIILLMNLKLCVFWIWIPTFMFVCVNYMHLTKNMIPKCLSGCEKHVIKLFIYKRRGAWIIKLSLAITEKHKDLVYSSQQANKTSLADDARRCQKYQVNLILKFKTYVNAV